MDISHWQRVRLDPSTPLWWRADGTLMVGHTDGIESAAIEAPHPCTESASLIQLLDGDRSTTALLQSAMAMGLSRTSAQQFLHDLAISGHIHHVEAVSSPRIATNVVRDVRHLAQVRGRTEDELLAQRESLRVLVIGEGLVAAALHVSVTQAGLVAGWQSKSSRKVRLEDCAVPWLNPDSLGQPWRDLSIPLPRPDVVLVVSQTLAARDAASAHSDALVLPLTVHPRRLAAGPLLNLKHGICADCIDASRAMADADWAYRLAQIKDSDLAPPLIAETYISSFVGTVTNFLLELADTGRTSTLHEQSWELIPPHPQWRTRRWSRISDCRCNDFQQEGPAA